MALDGVGEAFSPLNSRTYKEVAKLQSNMSSHIIRRLAEDIIRVKKIHVHMTNKHRRS